MNISELHRKLIDTGIPERWYVINTSVKSDTHVLEEYSGFWKYYYIDEKGNQRNQCVFNKEEDACQYFYDKLYEIFTYFPNR